MRVWAMLIVVLLVERLEVVAQCVANPTTLCRNSCNLAVCAQMCMRSIDEPWTCRLLETLRDVCYIKDGGSDRTIPCNMGIINYGETVDEARDVCPMYPDTVTTWDTKTDCFMDSVEAHKEMTFMQNNLHLCLDWVNTNRQFMQNTDSQCRCAYTVAIIASKTVANSCAVKKVAHALMGKGANIHCLLFGVGPYDEVYDEICKAIEQFDYHKDMSGQYIESYPYHVHADCYRQTHANWTIQAKYLKYGNSDELELI